MHTGPITTDLLSSSVIAVPPLVRRADLTIAPEENRTLARYLQDGGIRTLLYGGNAVFYHVRFSEYAGLLETLATVADAGTAVIPSVGPSYGMMMDQAEVLRGFDFPAVMVLPTRDMATEEGVAVGVRRFAERLGKPVVLYIKFDGYLNVPAVRALVDDGLISWIKYAIVRPNAADDDYLKALVEAVDPRMIVSGMGEQPAIVHMRDFGLAGFTSGCVCVAPRRSMAMLAAIGAGDWEQAEAIRASFAPLEDLRNNIHPVRVLHWAVEAAGIVGTGPVLPLLTEVEREDRDAITAAAQVLLASESA